MVLGNMFCEQKKKKKKNMTLKASTYVLESEGRYKSFKTTLQLVN